MRLTVLLALLLTLPAWCAPWMDWHEPFWVDEVALGDEERQVCTRWGSPPKVRLVGSNHDTLWIYPERSVLFRRGGASGISGLELKQAERVLARVHEANREFVSQVGTVEPAFSGYRCFTCPHVVWAKFIPMVEKYMLRVRYEKGQLVSFEIEDKESRESFVAEDMPSSEKLLPRVGGVRIEFDTTAGSLEMELYPEARPAATGRVISLVKSGFYDDTPFFQVLPKCQVSFGVNSRSAFQGQQDSSPFRWSKNAYRLEAGTVALRGPTYLQINLEELADGQHAPIIGRITRGLENLKQLGPLNVVHQDLDLAGYWKDSGGQAGPRVRSARILQDANRP